jgi:hypothetical protein
MRSNSKNEQPRSSNEIAAELRMADEVSAANKKGRAEYIDATNDPVDVIEAKLRDFDRIEESLQTKINRLKAELAAARSHERAEARAVQRADLDKLANQSVANVEDIYVPAAKQLATILQGILQTDAAIKAFNDSRDDGEAHIPTIEHRLGRFGTFLPLAECVSLPAARAGDPHYHEPMTDAERSARSAHHAWRDKAMITRVQNEVATAKSTLSDAPLAIHPSGKLDLRRTA